VRQQLSGPAREFLVLGSCIKLLVRHRGCITDDSGRHNFSERIETVERFVNQHGGQDALSLCRCCDLEQSLSTEIHRK
jgi:hypothetical protein